MANWRRAVYNLCVLVPAVVCSTGCGKPAPKGPPPGAPAEVPQAPPDVELSTDLGTPQEDMGGSIGSPAGEGTRPAEANEEK